MPAVYKSPYEGFDAAGRQRDPFGQYREEGARGFDFREPSREREAPTDRPGLFQWAARPDEGEPGERSRPRGRTPLEFEEMPGGPPGFGRVREEEAQRSYCQQPSLERPFRQGFASQPDQQFAANPYLGGFRILENAQPAAAHPNPSDFQSRLAHLEEQVRANTDKAAMESELRRHATAIDPFKKRGLFAQHEMFSAIYAAPTAHKGTLALADDMGVFLKNRCIKLNYMAEDIHTFAQQKVRELGENPTAAQVAAVEKEVLRCFQEKKVKAEEVLAKHPEWLREENRGQYFAPPPPPAYHNQNPGQWPAGRGRPPYARGAGGGIPQNVGPGPRNREDTRGGCLGEPTPKRPRQMSPRDTTEPAKPSTPSAPLTWEGEGAKKGGVEEPRRGEAIRRVEENECDPSEEQTEGEVVSTSCLLVESEANRRIRKLGRKRKSQETRNRIK
ncbi:reverse transcriptase [Klebsormidium nitens]|uniref:Reverse transcriptase n=1 Tax=Klebsormidium nitens TaxID=105231 RepID=A0A1Y1IGV4_KLENI|nr:reverse transcriptase [Klebsormidium nitens]|eukprot:GAQ90095.1 reverse transcriptase [Klebsormidium nitens]